MGVGGALFIAPAIAVIHYCAFAGAPVWPVIRVGKIAEKSRKL